MDPSNALTHYYHGAALAMAARPEEAVAAYEQAVSLDAELTGAHIGLGHVLKTIGDQEGGVKALTPPSWSPIVLSTWPRPMCAPVNSASRLTACSYAATASSGRAAIANAAP